VLEIGGTIPHP